jgi:hypothetical protein
LICEETVFQQTTVSDEIQYNLSTQSIPKILKIAIKLAIIVCSVVTVDLNPAAAPLAFGRHKK